MTQRVTHVGEIFDMWQDDQVEDVFICFCTTKFLMMLKSEIRNQIYMQYIYVIFFKFIY